MSPHRIFVGLAAAAFVFATSQAAPVAQNSGASAAAPRTPWGDPDLQGTYTSDNSIGVPFARPAEFGTRTELTDAEFEARLKANTDQLAKDENDLPESK